MMCAASCGRITKVATVQQALLNATVALVASPAITTLLQIAIPEVIN